jgi:calcium-translocating P-type ATPase
MNNSHPDWHSLDPDDILRRLDSTVEGLDDRHAQSLLAEHGPNTLPSPPRQSALLRFLIQFHNLFIYVLMVAGMLAGLLGHGIDAGVILAVVIINAIIGFVQEGKAEKAMAAIGQMLAMRAEVRRNGRWQKLTARDLVPGDIVRIRAGDRIPADMRLLEAHELQVDQATLTGESLPVEKDTRRRDSETDLAERGCMVHSGTMTTNGQAVGVVVVTGIDTELGRISGMLKDVTKLTTPLLRQINRLAQRLTVIILALTVLVIALGTLIHAMSLSEGLVAGIALAVAAIPEGLPAIITITLAIGVQRMASRRAIIRRLPAVETLGSIDTICSDKTGTLTLNELQARMVVHGDGQDRLDGHQRSEAVPEHLLQAAVLCNDFEPGGDGDPIEKALLELAERNGLDIPALRQNNPRLALVPFSSRHKYMASLNTGRVCVKGAPETVLALCSKQLSGEQTVTLEHNYWNKQLKALTEQGLRVLALAEKPVDTSQTEFDKTQDLVELTLLGLVGFADPPRPEVPAAIAACQDAGIKVKMITGDHASTALAIAREIGISDNAGRVLSGQDLDALDAAGLADAVRNTDVFARTSPEHKLRLVEALQSNRCVVAMTGDGANDAPALKRADIGVAMGIKGTEASRQAAEMVLADDNFATIVSGVEEGRGVYDNIRKTILFILPTNAAEALVILLAIALGLALPITPVQILWINMATAVTLALALAFEPLESNVMRRPPHAIGQSLLNRLVVFRVIWVGLLLTTATFYLFNQVLVTTGDEILARTLAVNVLVAGEITYLFNCRRWQSSSLAMDALFANPWAWLSSGLLILMQIAFTYQPTAQQLFGTTALPPDYWLVVAGVAASLFLLVETEKLVTRSLGLAWASPEGT